MKESLETKLHLWESAALRPAASAADFCLWGNADICDRASSGSWANFGKGCVKMPVRNAARPADRIAGNRPVARARPAAHEFCARTNDQAASVPRSDTSAGRHRRALAGRRGESVVNTAGIGTPDAA